MVAPHSYFMKYLVDEEDPEDGVNYKKKYITWHAM